MARFSFPDFGKLFNLFKTKPVTQFKPRITPNYEPAFTPDKPISLTAEEMQELMQQAKNKQQEPKIETAAKPAPTQKPAQKKIEEPIQKQEKQNPFSKLANTPYVNDIADKTNQMNEISAKIRSGFEDPEATLKEIDARKEAIRQQQKIVQEAAQAKAEPKGTNFARNNTSKLGLLVTLADDLMVNEAKGGTEKLMEKMVDDENQSQEAYFRRQMNMLISVANKTEVNIAARTPEQLLARFKPSAEGKITAEQMGKVNEFFDKILTGATDINVNISQNEKDSRTLVEQIEGYYVSKKAEFLKSNSLVFVEEAAEVRNEQFLNEEEQSLATMYLSHEREYFKNKATALEAENKDSHFDRLRVAATEKAFENFKTKDSKIIKNHYNRPLEQTIAENNDLASTSRLYNESMEALYEKSLSGDVTGVVSRHLNRCYDKSLYKDPKNSQAVKFADELVKKAQQAKQSTEVTEQEHITTRETKFNFGSEYAGHKGDNPVVTENTKGLTTAQRLAQDLLAKAGLQKKAETVAEKNTQPVSEEKSPKKYTDEERDALRKQQRAETVKEIKKEEKAKQAHIPLKDQIALLEETIAKKAYFLEDQEVIEIDHSNFVNINKARLYQEQDASGKAFKNAREVKAAAHAMNKVLEFKQTLGGLKRRTEEGKPNPEYQALEKEFGLDSKESMEALQQNPKSIGQSYGKLKQHLETIEQKLDEKLVEKDLTTTYEMAQIIDRDRSPDDDNTPSR